MIRTIVVDDEPIARAGLREFVALETDLDLVAECHDGAQAIAAIDELKPDLILLDIEMPGLDGIEIARSLDSAPAIIFVTAYDRHALEAFEARAIDYLLKPVDLQRFRHAIDRARRWLGGTRGEQLVAQMANLLQQRTVPKYRERFLVREAGRLFFVKVRDVAAIESRGNYARLHAGSRKHLIRETMAAIEEELDPSQFVRVHRSHIVNLDAVRDFQTFHKGELSVFLLDGVRIPLSRRYRELLEATLSQRR